MQPVFLFDVDNTLLDNDSIVDDLKRKLQDVAGLERADRYWDIFEQLRREVGYADYLGALQRWRLEDQGDPLLLTVSSFLIDYPFATRLIPGALELLNLLSARGTPVILSDGDVVFQPRKIERSGLFRAVDGRVLIYVHKERELANIERRYPADHYVLVDDKIWILSAFKKLWGDRVTTVRPQQGHYARDPRVATHPPADVTIQHLADLGKEIHLSI